MKKIICILAATALLLSLSVTVLAHGGHGRSHRRAAPQTEYALCIADGCDILRPHLHDGSWYCGQVTPGGDYAVCGIEGCPATALHEHDGTYYHCPVANTATLSTGKSCCRQ